MPRALEMPKHFQERRRALPSLPTGGATPRAPLLPPRMVGQAAPAPPTDRMSSSEGDYKEDGGAEANWVGKPGLLGEGSRSWEGTGERGPAGSQAA